jgi:hypothetical protein
MSIKVVGMPGSLRERSFNRGLLRAAIELAPAGMEIQLFTRLRDIPPYNADVNPEPVQALKTAIREADAMLIATPEYNYGGPGVLKNAIDWASRPRKSFILRLCCSESALSLSREVTRNIRPKISCSSSLLQLVSRNFNMHRRAIGQHFGYSCGDFVRVVAHANNRVGG